MACRVPSSIILLLHSSGRDSIHVMDLQKAVSPIIQVFETPGPCFCRPSHEMGFLIRDFVASGHELLRVEINFRSDGLGISQMQCLILHWTSCPSVYDILFANKLNSQTTDCCRYWGHSLAQRTWPQEMWLSSLQVVLRCYSTTSMCISSRSQ